MPTPRKKKPPARRPAPKPQHHRMTAEEYFIYRRDKAHEEFVKQADRQMASEEAQLGEIDNQQAGLGKSLSSIKPGFHWVTIHWLVPHGAGFRAETISGQVKEVDQKKRTLEFWVNSVPDETALHGIANGDILEVPFEAVTSVSAPTAT